MVHAISKGSKSKTIIEAIDAKEKRQRLLKYQIKQTKALQQEKIYVTPAAMKEKFRKLAERAGQVR